MTTAERPRLAVDWVLLGATLALSLIGIAFIHSAESGEAGGGLAPRAARQAVYLLLSFGVLFACLKIGYRRFVSWSPWIFGAALCGLVAVLAFGTTIGGNQAWLRIGGLSVQPSELAKVAAVLVVAHLAARLTPGRLRLVDALPIVAVVAVPMALILRQDDMGTALTFVPLVSSVLFVAGLRWRWIVLALVVGAALAPVGWSHLKPYQQDRLRIFVNPELDPSGKGYHAIQSRIAVGSGGITGQGYTEGPQNRLGFLPERHTDYIFAIIAEEWGFLGAVLVLALYLLVLARLARGVACATDRAGAFACLGVLSFLAAHVVVNVGMALALLPTIGIPLPLVSYGGTALLASWAMIGVAASVPTRSVAR